jgi:hypothetical protein
MGALTYTATDENGTPLAGVHVSQKTVGGWCAANTQDGYTDASGKVTLDNGCIFPSDVNWTAQAPGYQSQSGHASIPFTGSGSVDISMPYVVSSIGGQCPPGYVQDSSGNCVQIAGSNWLQLAFDFVKNNWLLILVLVAAAAVLALLFLRPGTVAQVTGAAVGAVGGAA